MMPVIGKEVAIVQCSNATMVGLRGTVALESMHMITVVSGSRKLEIAKKGTVLKLQDSGKVVIGDEMAGRVEDRLSRGSRL